MTYLTFTIRLREKPKWFEFRAPKPTLLTLEKDKLVFTGDPKKQDNSVMHGPKLELNKNLINKISFNKIKNSTIKLILKNDKTYLIQFLADSIMEPYNIYETDKVYKHLKKWFK